MSGLTEEEIRTKAYQGGGRTQANPACKMDKFWYEAESELLKERTEMGDPRRV